jgi:DNA polymerase
MFVGEAPGADEDRLGEPFVGRSGQSLTKIIKAMGFERSEVYIANTVKHRPPQNRTPTRHEIAKCHHFLLKQLEVIGPKIIVALGTPAAQTLLDSDRSIGAMRGRFHPYPEVPEIQVMPTYHPAYLLRNANEKVKVWDDMKKVMAELGVPVP